jgi:Prenyltransferase and squalene oxidase repeat
VTDQQSKLGEEMQASGKVESDGSLRPASSLGQRTNAGAIAAGLKYLVSQHHDGPWGACGAEPQVTACVLARLGELPPHFVSQPLRQTMEKALQWLVEARTPEGGWSSAGKNDAESTAWAVIALRNNNRPVPESALQLIRRCRRLDGGFATRPEGGPGDPEITALAIQALGVLDSDTENFLLSLLQSDGARLASPLGVCSAILDWEKGLAPLSLLNQACQLTARFAAESALEQALLLHCLVRLRLNRAWTLAACLRAAQLEDGSWPGPSAAPLHADDKNIIPTATAVSALALGESQPGLYFGSDLPRPRRLHES